MITFSQYMICKITGAIRINCIFPAYPENHIVREFTDKSDAMDYIQQMQQGALNYNLIEWVHHKRHIATNSTWYADADRKKALEGAHRLADDMLRWNLWQSCREVIAHKEMLYAILPAPANSSFESSRQKLEEMIAFCEKTLSKPKNQ